MLLTSTRARHRRSYDGVSTDATAPRARAVKATSAVRRRRQPREVVGVDVLDEVAELVDDLLRLLLGLGGRLLADLVEQLLGGEHRGRRSARRGRWRRTAGWTCTVSVAVGAAQVQLGEVRVVAHLGDDDLLEGDAELGERLDEQVVGQRPGRRRPPRGRSGSPSPRACRCRSAAGGGARSARAAGPSACWPGPRPGPRRAPAAPRRRAYRAAAPRTAVGAAAAVRARGTGAARRASSPPRSLAPSASSSSSWRGASAAGLRVALAQQRHDQLLVQAGLALDRRAPRPQVPGIDAGAQEPAGGGGDLDGVLAVQLAVLARRLAITPYSSSCGELVAGHRRHRAQLVAVDEHTRQQSR